MLFVKFDKCHFNMEVIREKLQNNVNMIYSENPYNLQRQTYEYEDQTLQSFIT